MTTIPGPDLGLSELAALLTPFVTAVSRRARRVCREREAGSTPFAIRYDIVEQVFDETLARLCEGSVNDAWWRALLDRLGHAFITPEFLNKPAVQEWLADEQVKCDFKVLARARMLADADDEETLVRLKTAYAQRTGELDQLASGPIDAVAAVLVAGYLGGIEPQDRAAAGMIQASVAENRAEHERTREAIRGLNVSRDPIAERAHSKGARDELGIILKRRFDAPRVRGEIVRLADSVIDGDLRYADRAVRLHVFYWAARLHASDSETLPVAKGYRSKLVEPDPGFDYRIVDGLIEAAENNVDRALRLLRDVDSSDGRSTLLTTIKRTRGSDVALAWFDNEPGRNRVDFLTGPGWCNVALCLVEGGRWEEAADRLLVAASHVAQWPYLTSVEGVINAAMLLPTEYRNRALEMRFFHPEIHTVQGPDVDRHRTRAEDCFRRAVNLMREIDQEFYAQTAEKWFLWLRLTSPSSTVSETARLEVQEDMKDGRRAIELLPFARAFRIVFSDAPTRRYLADRERLGGLEGPELVAKLFLAEATLTPRERAEFLEREEAQLAQAISKATLAGMRIEALLDDGQIARAQHLLEERRGDLVDHDYERLRAMILTREGRDPRSLLEDLYRQTGDLIDLQNLVGCIEQSKDWISLLPLLRELFRRERTPANAVRLIECMRHVPVVAESGIISFFQEHTDVVGWGHDFVSAKAWALFHMGDSVGAKTLNDRLLLERTHVSDLQLDINLAIQFADWERFPVIVDREWSRRYQYEPKILLRLASLAAAGDPTSMRAYDLARLAADKANNAPDVLMSAYLLVTQLGREDEISASWLARAAELSSSDGPVWRADFRTIVEKVLPAQRERAKKVEESLLSGAMPLHIAAGILNIPISRVLLDFPQRNAEQKDGRKRIIVPIVSGGRQATAINADWTIGLDITSLLVLAHLGLLRATLSTLKRVVLASETMIILLNERRRVQFHQPSLLNEANEIRELIDCGRLTVASGLPKAPQWLIDEVGRELAEMLEVARMSGGRVVRPHPIYKLGTYLDREAELRDYARLIISSGDFARLLFERGKLAKDTYERACRYLAVHDRGESTQVDSAVFDHPVYLDDLALTYLHHAAILDIASSCGLDLRVHPEMSMELADRVAANRGGEQLASVLDDIRRALWAALEAGKILFLARRGLEGGEEGDLGTLSDFLVDAAPCDAVSVDDRFVNRHASLSDRAGHSVQVLCVLDVLRHLEAQGVIDVERRLLCLHRLREGGLALMPLEAEELGWMLGRARFDQDVLIESAEMRILRQHLMRLRSLGFVNLQLESAFLAKLQFACIIAIRRLWEDANIPAEHAAALSDWVWHNIAPSPLDWVDPPEDRARLESARGGLAQQLALLFAPILGIDDSRNAEFCSWAEQGVIGPLLPANVHTVDEVAGVVRGQLQQLIEQLGGSHADGTAG